MLQRMKKITVSEIKSIYSLQKNTQLIYKQTSATYIRLQDEHIIIFTNQSILKVYNLNNSNVIFEEKIPLLKQKVKSIVRSGILIALICDNVNQLTVINMKSKRIDQLEGHICPINELILLNPYFVTASKDLTIRFWQILENSLKQNNNSSNLVKYPIAIKGHKGSITTLAVYDKFLISGSDDRTIMCWVNRQIWTSSQPFSSQIAKILCCPLSSQVFVLTKDNILYFIPINSIAKKKIQIKGLLNFPQMTIPTQIAQIDDSFVVIFCEKSIRFIQVNLMKQMHDIEIQSEFSDRISDIRSKSRCLFIGQAGLGVKLLKI